MALTRLLICGSILILIFLLWDSCMRVDVAATKNDHSISFKKAEVDTLQNIDSVKSIAKHNLDVIRQNFRNESSLAIRRIWILLALLVIHLYLLAKWKSERTT